MMKRTAARIFGAALLGLSISGIAYGDRGHSGGGGGRSGHFSGSSGVRHFNDGGQFHHRVFIGGAFIAPLYFPPPYYYYPPPMYPPVQYMEPYPAPSAPQSSYWFYCPDSGAYYPYVQQCPSGWQQVVPQPQS